jgi:2-oxoglutarate ferredoxin oxidoreductase subunit gamma
MKRKVIFSGFGGQGVLTLGQIVSLTEMNKGLNTTWFPAYGAEMRGGTANCSVIYSDSPIGSPIVKNEIDVLVAMNEPSLRKFENNVKKGGLIIIENSLKKDVTTPRDDVRVHYINAGEIANELGNLKVINVIMLGAYAKLTGDFTKDEAFSTLKEKLHGKESLLALNEEAINRGYNVV